MELVGFFNQLLELMRWDEDHRDAVPKGALWKLVHKYSTGETGAEITAKSLVEQFIIDAYQSGKDEREQLDEENTQARRVHARTIWRNAYDCGFADRSVGKLHDHGHYSDRKD